MFGIYPGTGSGSLTIESLHSTWERSVREATRPAATEVFSAMQEVYKEWKDSFGWGRPCSFSNYPVRVNEALLNSAALHSAGRSTAKDYYNKRHNGNYVKLTTRTGEAAGGGGAFSDFYVLQTHKVGSVSAADAELDAGIAGQIVNLVTSSGEQVGRLLEHMGIVVREAAALSICEEALRRCLVDHCMVVYGDFPNRYWRRRRRASGDEVDVGVCTCLLFVQHAECEHHAFVSALRGGPPNLNAVPEIRRRGRKPQH